MSDFHRLREVIFGYFLQGSLLLYSSLHFFPWVVFLGRSLIGKDIFVVHFLAFAEFFVKFQVNFRCLLMSIVPVLSLVADLDDCA